MNVELFVIVAAVAVIAAVAVWLLKKWAAKPNDWESKIRPQPPMQTEEMKPAEPVKPLPPVDRVVQPKPEQPKRK